MAASSGSKEVVGKTAFAIKDWKGGFGAFCKVIRTKHNLNPLYLSFYFRSKIYRGIISSIVTGANINNIRNDDLNNLEIPLPDLEIQQEIANVLEQADKARQQRKAANALTDQFLQSSFLSLFGDPVKNERGWEVKKLDTLCTKITDGEHATPIREDSGIKLLSARNVKNGYIDLDAGLDYIGQAEYDRINKRCNPEFDDVLLSCSGTVGRVSTVNITEPFSLVRSVALIKPKKNLIVPKYLEFFLRSEYGQYQIDVRANKSSQANIFTGPIKELDIVVPPLSLQQQFAGIVAQAEQLRQKQRESERELENLFQGLLQKYFG